MKQRRKKPAPRKPHSETQVAVKKENPKRPAISQSLIKVPAGEDQTSFERHNRLLAIEYSKTKRNETVVKELMKLSYPMRRNDILENGHTINLLQKYPFLQTKEHVRNNTNLEFLCVSIYVFYR